MAAEDDVVWMVRGAWVSLCVRAMCELGVADALDEARSLAELAARTSSDPATLARLLRCQRPASAASSTRSVSSMPSRTGREAHPSSVSALVESPR
jgi:hypothetical protein